MANAQDKQMAQCKKVEEYTSKGGEVRHSYQMELDGREFSIPESKHFKAVQGKFYYPVVVIADVARISKSNNPYIAHVPSVVWQEVK